MAQASIVLPPDGVGKKVPSHTFTWGAEGTVHAQGIFLCDSSGNVVGVTGGALNVNAASLPLPTGAAQEHSTAANPASARLSDGTSYLGTTAGRLHVSDGGVAVKTDGSATTQPVSVASLPAVRSTQDVARANVTLGFDGTIGIAAEALASIAGVKANTAVSAATTYSVTAGKTLRLTAMRAKVMAGGTAVVNAKVRLRANYAGVATATSPVYAELRPGITSQAAIANEVGPDETLVFPDGLEFPANASIALSHVMTGTVTGTQVSATLIGFEY